jgi:hypothetical protein
LEYSISDARAHAHEVTPRAIGMTARGAESLRT